ncbi:Secretin receptor [Trichinella papuae]|uniref:Secretin receptor n=1 Tax=Trichinella papuae TaxID=268474 RepID=A0A0V1N9Y0_9BILA|nr:Secretin receptor [Trichinella papuae]
MVISQKENTNTLELLHVENTELSSHVQRAELLKIQQLLKTLTALENTKPADKNETSQVLENILVVCDYLNEFHPPPENHCPYYFDRTTCWRPTPAGMHAEMPCPRYIDGLTSLDKNVSIFCNYDSTWTYHSSDAAEFLSVYGTCLEPAYETDNVEDATNDLASLLRIAQLIGVIGYCASLVSLSLASAVFLHFKRLHCSRNMVHLNLFLAFMLRAFMCLLQYSLFRNGKTTLFDGDLTIDVNGNEKFADNGSHWVCKSIITVWNYSLIASYFWQLMEGMYLHNFVYIFVFHETRMLGSVFKSEQFLDSKRSNHINFILCMNICRELFIKLRQSHLTDLRRYKKFAKSTFLLIILLGGYYFVMSIPMLIMDTAKLTAQLLACLFVEHVLSSLQGVLVATVYCFCNSEVRAEIQRHWQRWLLLQSIPKPTEACNHHIVLLKQDSREKDIVKQSREKCIDKSEKVLLQSAETALKITWKNKFLRFLKSGNYTYEWDTFGPRACNYQGNFAQSTCFSTACNSVHSTVTAANSYRFTGNLLLSTKSGSNQMGRNVVCSNYAATMTISGNDSENFQSVGHQHLPLRRIFCRSEDLLDALEESPVGSLDLDNCSPTPSQNADEASMN